ncbi:MAG: hypothetical protein IPM11_14190 [Micropruina sp.]|nr:hypothetical protein [Micropruina sp.]
MKNPGSASRTYTVTVFFTSKAATVLASASTTATVDPGKEAEWSVNATFAAPEGTRCVLRGVAGGTGGNGELVPMSIRPTDGGR